MADQKELTREELLARIAQLEAENRKQNATTAGKLSLRVSEKGGVSVYGLGRFPVTLYQSQWERLINPETTKAIGEFLTANADKLAKKE